MTSHIRAAFAALFAGLALALCGPLPSASAQTPTATPVAGTVIKDNADTTGVTLTGGWQQGTVPGNCYGPSIINDANAQKGSKSVTFTPSLPSTGTYDVYEWHNDASFHPNSVPHIIQYQGGTATVYVNQISGGGQWNKLGTYGFDASGSSSVTISNTGTSGFVVADAIRWVKVSDKTVYRAFSGKTIRVDTEDGSGSGYIHNFVFTVNLNNTITGTLTNISSGATYNLNGTYTPASGAVTITASSPSNVTLTGTLTYDSAGGNWTPNPNPTRYRQPWTSS